MNTLPPIPWSTTGSFMLGLLGLLSVVGLMLWIWNQGKRAFGRMPPINDELDARDKAIRRQIYAVEKTQNERREAAEKSQNEKREALAAWFRETVATHHQDCERRLTHLEENYTEMQIDRVRKWSELNDKISEVRSSLDFIRGKLEHGGPSI